MHALMDYHLTWNKCCPHWGDVRWPWPGFIPQRSRSHKTFKGQSIHACVCSITYICINGLPSNLVQMLSSMKWCAVTRIHTSKVKVTQDILRSVYTCLCQHYRSNNLYFLFSHSWPVVVYNFGGGIAVLWTALFILYLWSNRSKKILFLFTWVIDTLMCPRIDISPRQNKLTNDGAVNHTYKYSLNKPSSHIVQRIILYVTCKYGVLCSRE